MEHSKSPFTRIWNLVREEKTDIIAIYFFAILGGLIQLSLPLGVQAIIGFVLGGTLSASLSVLITLLVAGVLLAGMMQVNQMKIIEKIQQKIFVKYAYAFADRIPRLHLARIDSFYLPELVNRFFDTVSLQKSISKLLLDLPIAMIQILLGLILLSFYHPFFIFFGILLLLVLWLILYATGNKGLESSLAESTYKYALAGWFEEIARLVKSFKFSNSAGLHLKKADQKTIGYLKARTTHFGILLLQYRTLIAFKVMITAALLIAGVILLLNQQINIGQFVAAEIIILIVITSVEKIITNLDSVYDVLTAVEKIEKLTGKPLEISGSYEMDGAAENILNEVYAINYKTMSYKGNVSGRLKLSIVSTGEYVMPYFLSEFIKKNEGVELQMDVTNKVKVIESLEQNEVDFSLVSVLPVNLQTEKVELMENKLYLVGNNEQRFNKKPYDKNIFKTLPLIYRETGSGTRQTMEKYIKRNNLPITKKMELTSNEAVKQAVIAGLGYSIMPLIGIKNELSNGDLQIIPVKGFPIKSTWQLIWLKGKSFSPVAASFLNHIKSEKTRICKQRFDWSENY